MNTKAGVIVGVIVLAFIIFLVLSNVLYNYAGMFGWIDTESVARMDWHIFVFVATLLFGASGRTK